MQIRKVQISLYLDPALHKWAEGRAREEDRSLSSYISHLIRASKSPPKEVRGAPMSQPTFPAQIIESWSPASAPATPPRAAPVFDEVNAEQYYAKGLVRFSGNHEEALAYTRRCAVAVPKAWVPKGVAEPHAT